MVRFLKRRLGEIFKNRQEALHVDYVTNIRDYEKELPKSSSIYGIFKKRKGDDMRNRIVPHSFTFVRRERNLYAPRPSLSLGSEALARVCHVVLQAQVCLSTFCKAQKRIFQDAILPICRMSLCSSNAISRTRTIAKLPWLSFQEPSWVIRFVR